MNTLTGSKLKQSASSAFALLAGVVMIGSALAQQSPNGPPGPPPAMPRIQDTQYKSYITIAGEAVQRSETAEVTVSGEVGKSAINRLTLKSHEDDFNAIIIEEPGALVKISDTSVNLSGDGSNDFLGKGAGLLVTGGVAYVYDSEIITSGVVSSALVAAERATLKGFNSKFVSHGGQLPEDYVPVIGPGMKEPPAPLGITGTARTLLTMSNARSYFYNCEFIADGWGALSTDAAGGEAYLEVNDSQVTVNNSGYGAYADFGAKVVANRTVFDVATYTGVIAGEAEMAFFDSESSSGRNVVMIHSVMGNPQEKGRLVVAGGKHNAEDTAFWVKSANAVITLKSTSIVSESGVLLLAEVNEDKFRTQVNGASVPGTALSIENSNLSGDVVNQDSERGLVVSLNKRSVLKGALSNVTLSIDETSAWHATGNSVIEVDNAMGLKQIQTNPGVTVTIRSSHLKPGKISQPSGGNLIIETI